jgi:hypothetical protein
MGYVPSYPEDEKEHKKYHDKIVNGLYAPKIKSDKTVWEKDDYRITVVNYLSPLAQKKRAQEVGLIAHRDTPFDFAPYHHKEPLDERNVHLFLLYRKNRIVGLLIVERRDFVQRFTWQEYENAGGKELPKANPIWSIGLVWVHLKYRRSGLGSNFVQVGASYFDIEINSIGWYTPFTDDGQKLARSLCPESFFVAK